MPALTLVLGLILIGLGGYGYGLSESKSMTALIPAFIGLPILICGFLALKKIAAMHVMHLAILLALIAAIGSGMRVFKAPEDIKPLAYNMQAATAIVCTIYVILALFNFAQVRRRRKAE